MYGLRQSWFAAQMARFTARGAPAGAAAWPKRRRARVPGTVGPDAGKIFAFAEDAISATTAAPNRTLGFRECTDRFCSVSYATRFAFAKQKIALQATLFGSSRDTCSGTGYAL